MKLFWLKSGFLKAINMWDPISLFYCMWILNVNLPNGRLNVLDLIKDKEEAIFNNYIHNNTKLRKEA